MPANQSSKPVVLQRGNNANGAGRASADGPGPAQPKRAQTAARNQENLLAFIRSYVAERGFAPSVREMMDGVGIGSTSVVAYRLAQLERKGHIYREPGIARAIRLLREKTDDGKSDKSDT